MAEKQKPTKVSSLQKSRLVCSARSGLIDMIASKLGMVGRTGEDTMANLAEWCCNHSDKQSLVYEE